MQEKQTPEAGRRQAEPEIIPPGADRTGASRIWISTGPHHTMRIQMTRLGPIGAAVVVLLIGILIAAGLALLLGLALIGLAAAGLLAAGVVISGFLRRPSRR